MNRMRSTRKRGQDLELRLGHSESDKGSTLATMQNIGVGDFIVVDDDDDVIQVSSSTLSVHHESQSSSSRMVLQVHGVSRRTVRVQPAISEADLELRLGTGGTSSQGGRNQPPPELTINIADDGEEDIRKSSKRRKQGPTLSNNNPPVQVNKLSLSCPICMDSMKEETSTVCGHLFCRSCILSAIQVQKKCPTCRRKLTDRNIHRIFLSSNTS